MGNNRYEIIKNAEYKEWLPESPIKIEKSQLLFDKINNQKILQVKMFNLSNKAIRSVFLDFECFDDAMDFISSKYDVPLEGFNANPQSYFGDRLPIIMDSLSISNIKIILNKVVFDDDTIWRNENKVIGVELPSQMPVEIKDELYEQVLRECKGTNAKPYFWYESTNEYWRCSCGQPNVNDQNKCGFCGTSKQWLEQHFNKEYLLNTREEYLKSENLRQQMEVEYNRKVEEEKQMKQQEELDKQKQLKKRKKNRIILTVASIIMIIAIGVFIFIVVIPPEAKAYYSAMKLYNEGSYTEAISAFDTLGDYKDSHEMITKSIIASNYEYGISLLAEGEYEKASEVFSKLTGYKDSDEKLELAQEHLK